GMRGFHRRVNTGSSCGWWRGEPFHHYVLLRSNLTVRAKLVMCGRL
uniref:Uncharacterized protein n=1 Tax=Amphimedon queenslandica TaxID=400682 RepID=A0A1X7STF6_AMPQE